MAGIKMDQQGSKKWLIAAVLLAAAGGVSWWAWSRHQGAQQVGHEAGGVAFPWSRADSAPNVAAKQAELKAPVNLNERPAFLSAEEWAALQDALRNDPNRDKELPRIVNYLRFQKKFQLWQELRNSPDIAQRQAVAKELLDGMPERIANRELNGAEARTLLTALMEDIVPDPQERAKRVQEESKRLVVPPTPEEVAAQAKEAAQQKEYERRAAEITAQWQAMPPAQRDQAWLESQLDAARRAAFGSGK